MSLAALLHPIRTRRTRRRLQAAAQVRIAWWQDRGGLPEGGVMWPFRRKTFDEHVGEALALFAPPPERPLTAVEREAFAGVELMFRSAPRPTFAHRRPPISPGPSPVEES